MAGLFDLGARDEHLLRVGRDDDVRRVVADGEEVDAGERAARVDDAPEREVDDGELAAERLRDDSDEVERQRRRVDAARDRRAEVLRNGYRRDGRARDAAVGARGGQDLEAEDVHAAGAFDRAHGHVRRRLAAARLRRHDGADEARGDEHARGEPTKAAETFGELHVSSPSAAWGGPRCRRRSPTCSCRRGCRRDRGPACTSS